jgi:hypothetical protein
MQNAAAENECWYVVVMLLLDLSLLVAVVVTVVVTVTLDDIKIGLFASFVVLQQSPILVIKDCKIFVL